MTQYYFWDCWTIFDRATEKFHIFRLFAEQHYRDIAQHDKFSRLAYGTSKNLENFEYHQMDIIKPSDNSSSIWTGCIIRRSDGKYLLFYTERTTKSNYWANQTIRCAYTNELGTDWHRISSIEISPNTVDPQGNFFLLSPRTTDRTIHAWRDPFVFKHGGIFYMLVSAKSNQMEPHESACIALLKAKDDLLETWTLVTARLVGGYEELEVPQIYIDKHTNQAVLIASTWNENDYQESMNQGYNPYNNLANTTVRRQGNLLSFRSNHITEALEGKFGSPEVIVTSSEGLYAGVVVPELSGAIMGFDISTGKHRVLPHRLPNLSHPDTAIKLA